MRALRELLVRSPLRECGLTKAEIRRLSREAGLFTWDKPAYACLATRIRTGEEITLQKLRQTEKAEGFLFGLGFRDFRVRMVGNTAKLELRETDLPLLLEKYYSEIYDDKGKQGFIPAHAGNTKFVFMWDGEKGFIPAHAGNTIFPWLHPQK